MSAAFRFTLDSNGIGRLVINLPDEKVNKLSKSVLEELATQLNILQDNRDIKTLLILSGKENLFIAGADLNELERAFDTPSLADEIIHLGHNVFNQLQALPFPTISVIHGACLGGGLELALACTYRVATDHPKTQIGLPEVSLGLIPGWGGTQRLPRLVGLENSLPMILSGKPVNAQKAWKIGLVDAIMPWEFLQTQLNRFITSQKHRRQRSGLRTFLLEKNPIGRYLLFHQAKKNVLKRTKGHYPAPLVALKLIKKTHSLPLEKGLQKEIDTFLNSIPKAFVPAKHLIHLFFIREALKKEKGANATPAPIRSTAILGAGTMGSEIAWLLSYKDIPVRMKDISWEAVGKGFETARNIYSTLIKKRRVTPNQANLKFHRIGGAIDYSGFHNQDLVIEAAVEDLELKNQILAEVESYVQPSAIIATNTSSFTVTELANALKHPKRFVGMHFFNPASRMPLVEIVAGKKTSPETVATAVAFCQKIGKIPLVVGDCHGFLVNRIFATAQNAAMQMLEEGIPMARIESSLLHFGMPMGPFALADTVGNDVGYKAAKSFEKAYGTHMEVPQIAKKMYDHKFYGQKVGKGFYLYNGKKGKPNPAIQAFLPKKTVSLSEQKIVQRVIKPMVDEANRCLEEGIIDKADYLDMALILGAGFPPFRGGLLRYAKEAKLL